jgi:hypothetical protein
VLIVYAAGNDVLETVARRLGMNPETLKTHLRRIRAKYREAGRPPPGAISTCAPSRMACCRRRPEQGCRALTAPGPCDGGSDGEGDREAEATGVIIAPSSRRMVRRKRARTRDLSVPRECAAR